LVPIIFFFSAACTEKLRETTTNAAMIPTALLLSCVRGLSSQSARWSLGERQKVGGRRSV
jgi:hypothetical protein